MRLALLTGGLGLAAWLLGGAAQAQALPLAGDRLHALACIDARAGLDAALAAAPARPPSVAEARRIGLARREVARICLGQEAEVPRPSGRVAQPPLAVTPASTAPSGGLPPLQGPPAGSAGAPLASSPPALPAVLTACDATGCWDSHGRRLERAGPLLLTPQGPCTPAGGLLNCP